MRGSVFCGIPDIVGVLPVAAAVQGKLLRFTDTHLVAEYLPLQQGAAGRYILPAEVLLCQLQDSAESAAVKIRRPRLRVQKIGVKIPWLRKPATKLLIWSPSAEKKS